jgi:Tfp pilus assembly major pilin PilA
MVEYDIFTVVVIAILSSVIAGLVVHSYVRRNDVSSLRTKQDIKDLDSTKKSDKQFKKAIMEKLNIMRKQVEMLQTVAFGIQAHSTPNYMFGLDPEEGMEDKPGEGAFFEQSSDERTKQTSDNEERIRVEKDDTNTEYDNKVTEDKQPRKKRE